MPVTEVSSWAELTAAVKKHDIAIVDVYTEWCGPCKRAAPIFKGLSEKNPKIAFLKANLETPALSKLSSELGISSIPTFVVYKGGSVVKQVSGLDFASVKSAVEAEGGSIELTEEAEGTGSFCAVM